jgi:putative DNA primase/helicase
MSALTLEDAMRAACDAVGIKAPPSPPAPGRWKRTDTLGVHGKGDASIMIFDDRRGGIVWNWQTQVKQPFRITGENSAPVELALRRENEARQRREHEEAEQAAKTAGHIIRSAKQAKHPYLTAKGFPDELGLVHECPQNEFPGGSLGKAMAKAMPEGEGPWLIVPGRIGKTFTTVQFIGTDGAKKNLLRGKMGGASHRIATGAETWICEGIATALTVRAALRLLGRSATVLSAFSAANAASIASATPGAILATDNDKPVEAFGGLGTGEYYARKSGRVFVMPKISGDWNDYHQANGLRSVAMSLREVHG